MNHYEFVTKKDLYINYIIPGKSNYLFEKNGYMYKYNGHHSILRERDRILEELILPFSYFDMYRIFDSIITIQNDVLYIISIDHNPDQPVHCRLVLQSIDISDDKMKIISYNENFITIPFSWYYLYHTSVGITIQSDRNRDFIYNIAIECNKPVLEPISYKSNFDKNIHIKIDDDDDDDHDTVNYIIIAYDIVNNMVYLKTTGHPNNGTRCVIPGNLEDKIEINLKDCKYEDCQLVIREKTHNLKFCD